MRGRASVGPDVLYLLFFFAAASCVTAPTVLLLKQCAYYDVECPVAISSELYLFFWLYLGIADGMAVARVWACRYSK